MDAIRINQLNNLNFINMDAIRINQLNNLNFINMDAIRARARYKPRVCGS